MFVEYESRTSGHLNSYFRGEIQQIKYDNFLDSYFSHGKLTDQLSFKTLKVDDYAEDKC